MTSISRVRPLLSLNLENVNTTPVHIINNDKWNMITNNIYISSSDPLTDPEMGVLKENNINTVISLAPADYIIPEEIVHIKRYFPDHVSVSLDDYGFDDLCDELNKHVTSGKKVLINCKAGISRSATLVIYWLMKHTNKTFKEAIDIVREKRSCIDPNFSFIIYLMNKDKRV